MPTFYDLYDFSLFAEADRNRIDRLLQQSANQSGPITKAT